MAARASCTEAVRRVRLPVAGRVRRWGPATLGIAWGHASAAVALRIAAAATPLGSAPPDHWSVAVLAWTLLLPFSLTFGPVLQSHSPLHAASVHGVPAIALPLPALTGCALVWGAGIALRKRLARPLVIACATGAVLTGSAAGLSLGSTLAGEYAAEQHFLEIVAAGTVPWSEPASLAAAHALVERHPESRWASEAWRVLAAEAELRRAIPEAIDAWRSFDGCFGSRPVPGRAFAALSIARLLDGTAPADVAADQYHAAYVLLRDGGAGSQTWVLAEAAAGLERLSHTQGRYSTARRWAARASEARTALPDPTNGGDDEDS